MKEYHLQSGFSEIGQKDPVSKKRLAVGDIVIQCDRGHISLKTSWDFMGGKCPLCGTTVDGPIKKEEPDADTRAYIRPLESPVRGGTTGSTAAILLGIAICAAVTIGGIIAVATMSGDGYKEPIRLVTVVETVIVEAPGNNEPNLIVVTSPPRATSTSHPTNTPDLIELERYEIEQAMYDYDEARRIALETGNTDRLYQEATGDALEARLQALRINSGAGCHWDYEFRSLNILNIRLINPGKVEVNALIDIAGRYFCGGVERVHEAFDDVYPINYILEFINNGWIVTDTYD